jgi:hypothetical protein
MVLLASTYDQSRFFRAEDLKTETRLKIKNVTEEKMADGEVKLTVWFTNDKRGLVLNRTNNRTIRGAFGDAVDGWPGKVIVLFPTTTEIGGKTVPAMRVRIPLPKEAKTAAPKPTPKPPLDEEADGFDDDDESLT